MRSEVIKILKEKDKLGLFTVARYEQVKEVMKFGIKRDEWLKNYLSLDPLNRAQWVADHIIKLSEMGKI